MKKTILALLSVFLFSSLNYAQNVVWVGGEEMYASKNIVENAVNSEDHTTLVTAVKAAELVTVLQSDGPFTVFAPTNDAFENLPEGTVESLLMEENMDKLRTVLTYHVVPGTMNSMAIKRAIVREGGKATFTTVSGDKLMAMMNGDTNIVIQDENGNVSNITTYDVDQSNGVIHVIDTVLLPN